MFAGTALAVVTRSGSGAAAQYGPVDRLLEWVDPPAIAGNICIPTPPVAPPPPVTIDATALQETSGVDHVS